MAMVAFVNHYAPRLHMPFEVPLKDKDIHGIGFTPPECDKIMTLCGSGMQVGEYSFSFTDGFINSPYAHFTGYFGITKLEDDVMSSFGIPMLHLKETSFSLMERASRMKYGTSTNDIYRIATNYLWALEIEPNRLKAGPLKIEQGDFHSNRGLVPSPLIEAYWGKPSLRDPGSNGFAFKISAVSGELLELNVGNVATCKWLPLIKNLDKLVAISDADFLKYSSLDRSNLVVSFSGVHCCALHCPGFDDPLNQESNEAPPMPHDHNAASN